MKRYTENNSKVCFWPRWLCSKFIAFTCALCLHNGRAFQAKNLRSRLAKFPTFESLSVYFFLVLCLLLPTLMLFSEERAANTSVGPAPDWVENCAVEVDFLPPKTSQINLQYLLIDIQRHAEEKSCYVHYAIKALTQSGVSNIAQVNIDFDPTYEQVIVHGIRVYRDGRWIDRLQTARQSLLQRESELEQDLYSGELTLVYFLDDVCEGDVVEYAYTLAGEIPCFSSHFSDRFRIQSYTPVERFYRRLLINPARDIQIKSFNTALQPRIRDVSSDLREWCWDLRKTSAALYEEDTPDWYLPFGYVQLSEYKSWREVIEEILPIYTLPDEVFSDPDRGMWDLVGKWTETTSSDLVRAFLALRFVQEKVRYLGFEEGTGGFHPRDPRLVFQRRYGDCKDKTLLLSALLRMMGIDSTPTLVHASMGQTLPDALPSPFLFNHVILRINIEGTSYWVDPTMNYQGGSSLLNNSFPSYHWALPISHSSLGLVPLPQAAMERATTIETSVKVTSEDSAELRITWTFFDSKADSVRSYVTTNGIQSLADSSFKSIQKFYGKSSVLSPISYSDDRQNRCLQIVEVYRIPTQQRAGKKVLKVFSHLISDFLETEIDPDRVSPYALYYPAWIKEHIHVENPFFDWMAEEKEFHYDLESLFFSHSIKVHGHSADLHFELKHLKDHVSSEALYEYWETTNAIEQEHSITSFTIALPKSKAA